MQTPVVRRLGVAAMCGFAVLLPLAGATGAATLVRRLTTSGAAALDPWAALLLVAAAGLVAVLLWATAAVAAGAHAGWQQARHGAAGAVSSAGGSLPGSGGSGAGVADLRPSSGAATRGRAGRPTALVSTAVAALVVAALTAPVASAAVPTSGTSVVTADVGDPADAGPIGSVSGEDPAPGTWSVLAQPGFTAPAGVTPEAVALVSGVATRPAGTDRAEVVVTAGDTLWSLAAARLGPGASDAEVARAWPGWWEANRAVIGDDPHLLLPGQRLVVPTS